MPSYLIRVPDHLGDGVMAIAVRAIPAWARRWCGPAWASRMYGLQNEPHHVADVGVLLKPSFSAAWSHRPAKRGASWRLAAVALTDPVDAVDGHRGRTYDQRQRRWEERSLHSPVQRFPRGTQPRSRREGAVCCFP